MTRSIPEPNWEKSQDPSKIRPFSPENTEPLAAAAEAARERERQEGLMKQGLMKPLKAEGRTTQELTRERGAVYGPPIKHFSCTRQMFNRWLKYRNQSLGGLQPGSPAKEDAAQWAVNMILDKLSRLAHTIDHKDSWDDIQGYAECAKKILFGDEK